MAERSSPYFTTEHEQFRAAVRKFAEQEMRPHWQEYESAERLPEAAYKDSFRSVFAKAAQMGFLGIRVAPEYGGPGLDFWTTTVLCEELVRSLAFGLCVSMLAHAEFAISAVAEEGTPEQRKRYLPDAVQGKTIWGLGVTEPDFGSDVAGIRTTAVRRGDRYVISGSKTFITNGTIADYITLTVRTGGPGKGGISLVILPTATKGFSVGKRLEKIAARSSDTGLLFFDECEIPVENLIGEEGKGFYYIMKHFQGERLVLASFANGLMQLLWEEALKYGGERKVFGQRILEFQVWKHRLAEVHTKIEASRQLTYWACDKLVRTGYAQKEVSMAKMFATETIRGVAMEAAQIHGGNAVTTDFPVGRLVQESWGMTIGAGTSEIMREIIWREVAREGLP
ncbi:MAG: acyl-CoA dehydrogenase family protein [Nitrospirae bacterium]|nr:acyl-CoA dehydrogenase family protein [Nitrospirota bacterium]